MTDSHREDTSSHFAGCIPKIQRLIKVTVVSDKKMFLFKVFMGYLGVSQMSDRHIYLGNRLRQLWEWLKSVCFVLSTESIFHAVFNTSASLQPSQIP